MYTENERKVLSVFFTTAEGRVAVATDRMPSALWAYIEGAYSRSHEPIRRRFLTALFGKDEANESLDAFAAALAADNSAVVDAALDRAAKFLSKWAVEYGHNSLKEGAVVRWAIENLSIVAVKAFEDTKKTAFQEKSTRYLPFGKAIIPDLVIPSSLSVPLERGNATQADKDFKARLDAAHDTAFSVYESLLVFGEKVFDLLTPEAGFVNEEARKRTIRAKAFDEARYVIPLSAPTSFGAVQDARECERLLSRLLRHPLMEVREAARSVAEEVKKVLPGLLSRIVPDPVYDDVTTHRGTMFLPPRDLGFADFEEDFNAIPGDGLRVTLAASYLTHCARNSGHSSISFLAMLNHAKSLAASNKLEVLEEEMAECLSNLRMSRHAAVPRWLEVGEIVLEGRIDYGAFRDLQRHRNGQQWLTVMDAAEGYAVPRLLDYGYMQEWLRDVSLSEDSRAAILQEQNNLNARYNEVMREFSSLCTEWGEDPGLRMDAQYFACLGHKVVFSYSCNLAQAIYMLELRSQPAGHYSYREAAQKWARQLCDAVPYLSDFMFINQSESASRQQAENRTQEKLNANNDGEQK